MLKLIRLLCATNLFVSLQILSLEKPPPKMVLDPPPHVRQGGLQNNQSVNIADSVSSSAASTSEALLSNSNGQASSLNQPSDIQNGSNAHYLNHRRGSFLASEANKTPTTPSNMRRFDSHSLLSENSMASSRFDLSDGASYPE